MSHPKTALTLMMALALPGAAQALGLGEIHLGSGLNEPLAADIDLVGATADDLDGISVSIASRETFQQFGIDRSAFLSGVAFKISRDSSGRAILAIRSRDACTEPLLDMVVDVRWHGGELIRQYTLLLDPPGFPAADHAAAAQVASTASPAAPAGPAAPAVTAAPANVRVAVAHALNEDSRPAGGGPAARKTLRVGAKATLRGVAWRVGARSDADLKRMMIAIFRANPNAFEGNINKLRRGALLVIPSAAEASAISVADANHAVSAQMQEWHASTRTVVPSRSVASAVAVPPTPAEPAAPAAPSERALDRKVDELESRLDQLREQLDRENDALVNAQARLNRAEKMPSATASQDTGSPNIDSPASGSQATHSQVTGSQGGTRRGLASSIAAILALGSAAFGISAWRRRRTVNAQPPLARPDPEVAASAPVTAREAPHQPAISSTPPVREPARPIGVDVPETPPAPRLGDDVDIEALEASYILHSGGAGLDDKTPVDSDDTANLPSTVKLRIDDPSAQTMPVETVRIVGISESTTRKLRIREESVPAAKAGVEATKLDYNLVDLDATMEHVQMPSALHETAGFKERRTSLVDALKSAVTREPQRRDLQMKLLETYFAAAATNRQGFLEIVQKLAQERANMKEGEWDKIAWMGRQIAADDDLFAPAAAHPDKEDLADCA